MKEEEEERGKKERKKERKKRKEERRKKERRNEPTSACSWSPIVEFIEAQYTSYLNQEMQADRSGAEDTRIHACLYFIDPSGHT